MPFPPTQSPLARALAERAYVDPTPVQLAVLQPEAASRDLLVSAQTGSGKTVAFGLALGAQLLGEAPTLGAPGAPQALIVAPTRELALQVQRELDWLYAHARARVAACVGGMDPRREARVLGEGAHIVVGTPGRLRDHLERGRLDVSRLQAVVLDEADEMLDLGFREDLEFILDATPETRRTLMFSATLPRPIVALARKYQKDALRLEIAGGEAGHADIQYRAVRVEPGEIGLAVVNVLRHADAPAALVFCNTREAVRHLQAMLQERGFSVVALSGELSQDERNRALQALRDGRARVCVATDVAARGIDLPNLSLVVHADLPRDAEALQHRSGRTGRAGRKGVSVLLIPFARRRKAERLMVEAQAQPLWSGPPTAEEIRALDQERLLRHPALTEPGSEEDLALARALLAERSPEDVAVALARFYREQLPAAEDVGDPAETRRERPRHVPPEDSRERTQERAADNPGRRPPASRLADGVWFRVGIGREKNADPRWLLPMICRQGGVTRKEIGTIRIFDRESRFEIAAEAAPAFIEAVRKPPKGEARIELVDDVARLPDARPPAPPRERRPEAAPPPPPPPPPAPPPAPPSARASRHRLELRDERAGAVAREARPPSRRAAANAGDSPEPKRERPARKPFGARRPADTPFEKKVVSGKPRWQGEPGDRPPPRPGGRRQHPAGGKFAARPKKNRRD